MGGGWVWLTVDVCVRSTYIMGQLAKAEPINCLGKEWLI